MLKVKTKLGQHVVSNMTPDETIGNLKLKLSELTRIPAEGLNILIGFPPKPLDLSANEILLSDTGIINGDTLIVEEKSIPDVVPQQHRNNLQLEEDILLAQRLANQGEENAPCLGSQGILLKEVVPSDNSCLFTSIGELIIPFLNMTLDISNANFYDELFFQFFPTNRLCYERKNRYRNWQLLTGNHCSACIE